MESCQDGLSLVILEHSLTNDHISFANDIHQKMKSWCLSELSLDHLAQSQPEFTPETTLTKAVLINSLYGTNVWDIVRVSEYIRGLLTPGTLADADIELVERMAHVPAGPRGKKPKRLYSFSAKFAHFFITNDKFPILDSIAEKMIKWHLGRKAMIYNDGKRYITFVSNFNRLRESIDDSFTLRELDRYLWFAGQYYRWLRNPEVKLNVELREYFETHSTRLGDIYGDKITP